jgi:DNA-binding NarL/FixJ family response regulator
MWVLDHGATGIEGAELGELLGPHTARTGHNESTPKRMPRSKIVIADDHTMMAEALKHLLQEEFDVVATVGDGRALLKVAAELNPDLVVIDIGMPLLNGLDACEQLKTVQPRIKVIFLTQQRDPHYAAEAFKRQASGYLLKDAAASELTTAIREALKGRWYVSPSIAKGMLDDVLHPQPEDVKLRELSAREREVLQLLAEGKAMKEVAAILQISPRTVEFHKYRIMSLLQIKTNAELVQYAIRYGLIRP